MKYWDNIEELTLSDVNETLDWFVRRTNETWERRFDIPKQSLPNKHALRVERTSPPLTWLHGRHGRYDTNN
jgi:hypothetical protein